ncbi:3-methyladenine DNA glycosylase [Epibacterium sp. SM1979]|uniref:3-methyladenine DNA glycosylase n=1 Tax=Tritonibacter litoralis TaxID=2662264 RepID=A0A843Y9H5_9RHOB|nr:DNA-3-methyladenine glycosylase I [Tritonibacter litoralis]MQQ07651.1 3-methyladenine DNA glycosylase [Tritonibacter litoralis]
MRSFDEIYDIAADRQGGTEALEARLNDGDHGPAPDITTLSEDRWLATMTRCVFQAGFQWKVIAAKWEGFEDAFSGFDIGKNAMMDDEGFDALLQDTRIVRNGAKIQTVRDNAAFLLELRSEGGAGQVLGGWPSTDYVGLLDMLKKRGSRLGGATGQYAMRFAGRDAFILSQDVTARLVAEGVIDKPATSKGALKKVQEAFNTWGEQSGRSLTEMSRILALSV